MSTFRVDSTMSLPDALGAMRDAGIYAFAARTSIVFETGLGTGGVRPIDGGYAIDTCATEIAETVADLLRTK